MSVMHKVPCTRATMVHKSINGTASEYIKHMFKFVIDVSKRNIRYVDNFKFICPHKISSNLLPIVLIYCWYNLEQTACADMCIYLK